MNIATLNTWKNDGDYPARLDAMVSLLSSINADVVLLQENLIAETLQLHTSKYLAEKLNFDYHDAPSRSKERVFGQKKHMSSSGLSILTKEAVMAHKRFDLPSSTIGGERICQWIKISVQDHVLCIGNIHLSHIRSEFELKRQQWSSALEACNQAWQPDVMLIGGDMNTDLDHAEARQIFGFPEHQVIDCAKPYSPDNSKSTHPVPTPVGRNGRRIDTIFSVQNSTRPNFIRRISSKTLGKAPIDGVYPSDHALVLVELSIE
jgi:endonuclease/exonuclease/phosphatase family metal-dependent hydrolase